MLCAALGASGVVRAQDAAEGPPAILKDSDRVSLNLRNVDLFRVVELLMHDRGLNIVAAPELNKKVTVRLQGVNWREALTVILRQAGLGMEQVGNIVRIDTLDRILASPLRVEYPVKHLEKADVEKLARETVTPPSTFQVIEVPGGSDRPREVTLILNATGPEQEKMRATLARVDVGTTSRPVAVRRTGDGDLLAIDIDDMPVSQALDELGKQVGFSVVWEDPPRGRARVKLARVTVPETLSAVLSPLGLAYELSSHVLRVGEKARFQNQPRSRVYKLMYANPLHVKALLAPLLTKAGKIEVLGDVRDAATITAAQNAAGTNVATVGLNGVVTSTRAIGTRARSNTEQLTRQQPPSNTLLVTDLPAVLDQVEATICQLDKPAASVEIETKLVEVGLTKDQTLGIKWDANVSATGGSGTVVKFPLTDNQIANQALNSSFTLGTLSAASFNVMLRALSVKNKVKVLSAPRVTTISNEPARILIGQRFPITVAQNTGQTVNVLTTTLDYYEDIGIALTVTPRVTSGDMINIALKPEVSSIASLVDNRFPIIDTREAETRLNLRSGHTAVIGGLLQDRVERDEQGLPGLASLPVVGRLFGQVHKVKKRNELIVCVTPRIMAQAPPEEDPTDDEEPPLPPPPPGKLGAKRTRRKGWHAGHKSVAGAPAEASAEPRSEAPGDARREASAEARPEAPAEVRPEAPGARPDTSPAAKAGI